MLTIKHQNLFSQMARVHFPYILPILFIVKCGKRLFYLWRSLRDLCLYEVKKSSTDLCDYLRKGKG
jgi:hypothetical protein